MPRFGTAMQGARRLVKSSRAPTSILLQNKEEDIREVKQFNFFTLFSSLGPLRKGFSLELAILEDPVELS